MLARSSAVALLAVAALSFTAGCTTSKTDSPADGPPPPPPPPPSSIPSPVGEGIKQGLSLSALVGAGWSVCLDQAYDVPDEPMSGILAACAEHYMLLACTNGPTTDSLALAAADRRSIVTFDPGFGTTAHVVSHGVGWYFGENYSWGFFPAGSGVNRAPCDWDSDGTQLDKDRRLCWPTSDDGSGSVLGPGYRCGNNQLASSSSWRRIVLAHPALELEPNDAILAANELTFGDRIVARISTVVDVDYFSFAAPAGGASILVETFDPTGVATCPAGMDPWVDVLDGAGVPIAQVDDLGGELCPEFAVSVAEGANFVKLGGNPPVPFGYSLRVSIVP